MDHLTDTEHPGRSHRSAEPSDQGIARAVTDLEARVRRRPGFGRSIATSTTTLVEGLRCVSHDSGHRIETDLTAALGGQATGPTPSALLRAALGSCLVMGYRLRAAQRGIPLESVLVEVETESVVGGMLDPDSAFPPGFVEVRYRVEMDGPAPAGEVERLIEDSDRLSPVLDAVARANRVTRRRSTSATAATSVGGSER